MGIRLIIIIISLVLGNIGLALPAMSAGVSMDFSIGFNGHFQLKNWTPLSVVLENSGRSTRGRLEVVVTSGSEYQGDVYRNVYATEIDLPQNSRKRYTFTVIIETVNHNLILRLRQGDEIISVRSVDLRPYAIEKKFAVVADPYVAPDILSALPDQFYPANVRPKFLPETGYGYASVELLIMRAATIRELRVKQHQALTQWLRQGGYLVIGAGLNYGSLNDQMIQDIMPIRVRGHRQFLELESLEMFCSRPLDGIQPFLVLEAEIDDAKILLQENDLPLITLKDHGAGQIIFLSFDVHSPPFDRWDGQRIFWHKIQSLQPVIDRPQIKLDDQQIVNFMLNGMPLKFPAFKAVLIFVAGYLFLLWLFFKRIRAPGRSRRQVGLYLILMISLFTAGGYWGFCYPNLNDQFSYNSFCHIETDQGDTPARANYFIGLYSVKPMTYEFKFSALSYPVNHIVSAKSTAKIPHPYVLQKKDNGQFVVGSIPPWSHSFYRLNLNFAPPLTGHARRDRSSVTLTMESRLPQDLVNCLIYYNKKFLPVDDLTAHNRQTIKLDLLNLKRQEIFSEPAADEIARRVDGNGAIPYLRQAQRSLTSDLLRKIHSKYQSRSDSMILIGWMPAGYIQPEFSQVRPPGGAITMISWELPVEITL